ncbi:MAG: YncE family protein [Parafilimonas sp.]
MKNLFFAIFLRHNFSALKKSIGRTFLFLLAAIFFTDCVNAQSSGYHITQTFHIKSNGWWDYIAVHGNSLYVSHGTQVNILDKNTGDSLGVIPNTTGVHGIAFVSSLNKGYTSNGKLNTVTVFDVKTNEVLRQIQTGENPDAIFYDDYSNKIITCNGKSKNLSIIDPSKDEVVSTIPLSGKPEAAVSDGAGKIFVNNEDKSEIAVVDINNYKVLANWSIAPGEAPAGLSIDRKTKRLFSGCDNRLLIVVDATNGNIVDKITIGDGCDGTAFDPQLNYVFASNGGGTLTVIKEEAENKFKVLENVPTKKGARTLAVDLETHTVYLPTSDFGTAAANERPPMVQGSFQVLVLKSKL